MKRILGMVVAIAGVLAFSSAATAALVVFDVSGSGQTWSRSTDDAADLPVIGGPCGATGMGSNTPGSSLDCFRYFLAGGSSVTVDITGTAVTMIGGTLNFASETPAAFDTLHLSAVGTTTIYGQTAFTPAAYGVLSGDSILWTTYANFSTTGTITCTGATCGLVSLPEGVPLPFVPVYQALTNTAAATAYVLGQWDLNPAHTAIIGSTTAVSAWSNVVEDGNRRVGAVTFGPNLLGLPVPEPSSAGLILLGLGALALRARKA